MAVSPQFMRMSLLDFDLTPDEELPGYEASTTPAYDEDDAGYNDPLITYCLRQYDRKIQVLGGRDTSVACESYRFTTGGFRLFSKKPEVEVLYTSAEMRQRTVATISFQSKSALPWRPRAFFNHNALVGPNTRYDMEAINLTDWTFTMNGRVYIWRLTMRPVSHVLSEMGSESAIARFTYSERGALAGNGAEIGNLTVYRDRLAMEQKGMDSLVCGLMVAMTYVKKMGKYYRNESWEVQRAHSLTRELSPLQGASSASGNTL